MNEYPLTPKSTIKDLCEVLKLLKADAQACAGPLAIAYTQFDDAEKRAQAMYIIGQMDLLGTLLWVLDGTALREGIDDSTVRIRDDY